MMLSSQLARNIVRKLLVSPSNSNGLCFIQKAGLSNGKQNLYQQSVKINLQNVTGCTLLRSATNCSLLSGSRRIQTAQWRLFSCVIRPGAGGLLFEAKFAVPKTCTTSVRFASKETGKFGYGMSSMFYILAVVIFTFGGAYAGVPLYRMFCAATGLGGKAELIENNEKIAQMAQVTDRLITVRFNADVASSMRWNFRPQQTEVKVFPGETALAFYTAKNPTDKPIVGISTYNVVPFEAGNYFNKIQCFCFEEQRLNPHEQVDMPVFFYIDPEFAEDPKLEKVDCITLSYTFFEAKEGLQLPLPGFAVA